MCKQPWLSRRATLTYQTTIYHTTQCRAPPVLLPPACYGPGPPGATAARLLLPKPLQAAALILIRQYVIHVHNATCQYAAVQVARQGGVVGLCDLSAGHEACLQHPPWQVQNLSIPGGEVQALHAGQKGRPSPSSPRADDRLLPSAFCCWAAVARAPSLECPLILRGSHACSRAAFLPCCLSCPLCWYVALSSLFGELPVVRCPAVQRTGRDEGLALPCVASTPPPVPALDICSNTQCGKASKQPGFAEDVLGTSGRCHTVI